jgi:hypothetical protein
LVGKLKRGEMSKKIVELSKKAMRVRELNYSWCAGGVTLLTMQKFAEYILLDFLADDPNKDQLVQQYIDKLKSDPFEAQE